MSGSFISLCQDLPHARIIHFPLPGSSPCQDHSFPLTRIFPMPGSFISPYKDLPHARIILFPWQGSSPCQDHSFLLTMIFPMPGSFFSPYMDLPHASIIHFPIQGSSPCQHHPLPHARIFPMPALFTSPTRITASSGSVYMKTLYGDLNHLLQSGAFWVLGDRVTMCTCLYICRQDCVYMFIYM